MAINLANLAQHLDSWFRVKDFTWERMCGGPLGKLRVKRENIEAFLWPSLIAAAFWTGLPTLNLLQLVGIGVAVLTFWLLVLANRRCKSPAQDLLVQVVFLSVLGGFIFLIGPNEAGTGSLVYRHALIPIALIAGVCLLFSAFLAGRLLEPLQKQSHYGEYLKDTEMFQVRGTRLPLSFDTFTNLFFSLTSVLLQPMQLLLPVTASILLTPPAYMHVVALIVFLLTLGLLLLTAFDDRLDSILALMVRRFSRNAALGVSLVAVALAAARLAGNTYVTTIFDGASGTEILFYFLAAYAIAWWYDYWTERLIGQELFALIEPGSRETCAAKYVYTGTDCTTVPLDGRSVELDGLGRILVCREILGNPTYFQAWNYRDFFQELAAVGAPGGAATPLPQQISQRLMLYLGSTAFTALAMLSIGGLILHNSIKQYELSVKTHHGSGLELSQLIDANTYGPSDPAILVASSGGGTRAAVFAGAVLEGLNEERGNSIRAGSGVSGGSAALAYYAANRVALRTGDLNAWDTYFDRMEMPFIQDVIERAQEWRMTVHGRNGVLLAESFERRWDLDQKGNKFRNLSDFGLICNSTLAGRFDQSFLSKEDQNNLTLPEAATKYFKLTKSDVAGGRLILTNLNLDGAFARAQPPFIPGVPLPVVVNDQDIRVERAAALSANFPPVFSNAAIDVDGQTRYWVTDGGAADNRGLEPLLFAFRQAVTRKSQDTSSKLPSVTIVIIEASGIDETFEQNRGLGSSIGAGAHFADQLDTALYEDLLSIYQIAHQEGELNFYYIPMPRFLRTSGSFGTHWMLQKRITVNYETSTKTVTKTFNGKQVVRALRAAYGCRSAGDGAELANWIRDSEEFKSWCALRNALSVTGTVTCPCPAVSGPSGN